jgi:hypothetical protein
MNTSKPTATWRVMQLELALGEDEARLAGARGARDRIRDARPRARRAHRPQGARRPAAAAASRRLRFVDLPRRRHRARRVQRRAKRLEQGPRRPGARSELRRRRRAKWWSSVIDARLREVRAAHGGRSSAPGRAGCSRPGCWRGNGSRGRWSSTAAAEARGTLADATWSRFHRTRVADPGVATCSSAKAARARTPTGSSTRAWTTRSRCRCSRSSSRAARTPGLVYDSAGAHRHGQACTGSCRGCRDRLTAATASRFGVEHPGRHAHGPGLVLQGAAVRAARRRRRGEVACSMRSMLRAGAQRARHVGRSCEAAGRSRSRRSRSSSACASSIRRSSIDEGRFGTGRVPEADLLGRRELRAWWREAGEGHAERVLSFCMCPGGRIVASVSEPGLPVHERDEQLDGTRSRVGQRPRSSTTVGPREFGDGRVRGRRLPAFELERHLLRGRRQPTTRAPAQGASRLPGGARDSAKPTAARATRARARRPGRRRRVAPAQARLFDAIAARAGAASSARSRGILSGNEGLLVGLESRSFGARAHAARRGHEADVARLREPVPGGRGRGPRGRAS